MKDKNIPGTTCTDTEVLATCIGTEVIDCDVNSGDPETIALAFDSFTVDLLVVMVTVVASVVVVVVVGVVVIVVIVVELVVEVVVVVVGALVVGGGGRRSVIETRYSITCIQRLPKGSNKSGLLQQVVLKCRFN